MHAMTGSVATCHCCQGALRRVVVASCSACWLASLLASWLAGPRTGRIALASCSACLLASWLAGSSAASRATTSETSSRVSSAASLAPGPR